jgi:ABC-2 type transport system permease protein/lipopolysaccharide transport system permease protein
VIGEGASAFIESEIYLKLVRQPPFIYVCRVLWRHAIIFGHNFLVVIVVVVLIKGWPSYVFLLVIPGIVLLGLNLMWVVLILSIIGARFRDIQQMVNTLMQVLFFITPIFWPIELLGARRWIAEINPLYYFIELVRAPLLGQAPSLASYVISILLTFAGSVVALLFFARFRNRIVYWL